jgi:hypothetical protein
MKTVACSFLLALSWAGAVCAQQPVSLFDGKTLKGWKVVTCEAEVVDGAILLKAGNGFLQAEKDYGDFVFECDWKALNTNMWDSGVYFRAGDPEGKFPWPKQHQVNMRRGQEGAIAGADKAKAASLYKPGEWNHFKLTVKGKTAELEFNGEKAWSRGGIEPASGHLCLQAEVPGGGQFLFKNLTLLELGAAAPQ